MSVTVVVPTRGRPKAARELALEFDATKMLESTSLLFAVDEDDPELPNYLVELAGLSHLLAVAPRIRMGPTLNRVAVQAAKDDPGGIVGFMGDDHRPRTIAWDQRATLALKDSPGVCYGNDLIHGPNLPTSVFVSSRCINQLGYMNPPGLIHLYLDNFWKELGHATNLTYLGDVVIEHLHPIAGKADWDAGYVEVNSGEMQEHDRLEFERFMAQDWPTEREKLV